MKPGTRILLALRNFWKKYWKYIIIIAIVWITVIIINNYLKNRPEEISVINTYTPDLPVMDTGESVPQREREEVNNVIDTFFNYCNNKEYKNAFDMLTTDCQDYMYNGSLQEFMEYVDSIYTSKKIYNIQNYSNVGSVYIYDINILDDILSTGTTGGYQTYSEKLALIENNGEYKISNQGYIGKTTFNNVYGEDNYVKISIIDKNMSYQREEYAVQIANKTDGYIVIANGNVANEITINLGDQSRPALDMINNPIILAPGQTTNVFLLFDKYYDDGKTPTEMSFNLIRVYGNNEELATEGLTSNANVAYSMNINLSNN